MYSFQVGHYATSDNLVSQSLHAFSLRHLITRDFLAPFLRLFCNGCSLAFLVNSVIQACSIGRQAAF